MELSLILPLSVELVVTDKILDGVLLEDMLLVGEAQIPESRLHVAPLVS